MTRIRVKVFIWDSYNIEHIKKHKVSKDEVEHLGTDFTAHKQAKKGRYLIIGRVGARILSAVIRRKHVGVYYLVTARDSDKDERKLIYEKEKKQTA